MKRINFTDDNLKELLNLASNFLFSGIYFEGQMGTQKNVYDLIHSTSPNTLKSMKQRVDLLIKSKDTEDEWTRSSQTQREIDSLNTQSRFLFLLVGYKLSLIENASIVSKRAAIQSQIDALEDANKSPEQKIAELKAEMDKLG